MEFADTLDQINKAMNPGKVFDLPKRIAAGTTHLGILLCLAMPCLPVTGLISDKFLASVIAVIATLIGE